MTTSGLQSYFWMLCSCGWFSAMSLLSSSLGAENCPWQTMASMRSAIAAALALLVCLALRVPLTIVGPRVLWLRSIAGSCSMLATFFALANLQASEVLTLTMTFPVWVAILSWPILGEIPTKGVWIAALISVGGVFLAVMPPDQANAARPMRWLPVVSAVSASIFTAFAMLGLNRLKSIPPLAVVVHFSAVAMLFALASYFFFEFPPAPTGFETTASTIKLFAIGITAMIGQVFLTLAFSRGTATKVSVVGLSQVVMVMAFEAIMGWKSFTLLNVLGTLLILGPTAWLMARARRESKAASEPLPIE